MDEQQATAVAKALGGETWQSGGGIWMVIFHRGDGKVAALTDEAVCVYADGESLDHGEPQQSVVLS